MQSSDEPDASYNTRVIRYLRQDAFISSVITNYIQISRLNKYFKDN